MYFHLTEFQSEFNLLCGFLMRLNAFLLKISSVRWNKIPSAENLGNFELLIDEELATQTQEENLLGNMASGKQRVNNRWK